MGNTRKPSTKCGEHPGSRISARPRTYTHIPAACSYPARARTQSTGVSPDKKESPRHLLPAHVLNVSIRCLQAFSQRPCTSAPVRAGISLPRCARSRLSPDSGALTPTFPHGFSFAPAVRPAHRQAAHSGCGSLLPCYGTRECSSAPGAMAALSAAQPDGRTNPHSTYPLRVKCPCASAWNLT